MTASARLFLTHRVLPIITGIAGAYLLRDLFLAVADACVGG